MGPCRHSRLDAGVRQHDPYAVWRLPVYRLYASGWFLITFAKLVESVAVGVHVYAWTKDPCRWAGWVWSRRCRCCSWRLPAARSPTASTAAGC